MMNFLPLRFFVFALFRPEFAVVREEFNDCSPYSAFFGYSMLCIFGYFISSFFETSEGFMMTDEKFLFL